MVLELLVSLLELIEEGRLVWEGVELARRLVLDLVTRRVVSRLSSLRYG